MGRRVALVSAALASVLIIGVVLAGQLVNLVSLPPTPAPSAGASMDWGFQDATIPPNLHPEDALITAKVKGKPRPICGTSIGSGPSQYWLATYPCK